MEDRTELNHVRGLLLDYINKNKLLKEKIKELEDALGVKRQPHS
jgi:hypothetical protein